MKHDDCVFCKIASGEIETDLVFEGESCVAFRDLDPQAPVHLLFIPREHISTLNELHAEKNSALLAELFSGMQQTAENNGISEDGYRVVINCNKRAGQEVFHLHFHLLGGRDLTWPPG